MAGNQWNLKPRTVRAIYRYPVKGLSPQALERARLTAGQTIPADRLYAIENGPTGFDPAAPAYFPKQRFLMLMRNERLAALRTEFDEATPYADDPLAGRRSRAWRPASAARPQGHRGFLCPLLCR